MGISQTFKTENRGSKAGFLETTSYELERNEPSVSIDELSSSGCDQNIAGQGELEPGGDGETVDRSDDRFSQPLHLNHRVGLRILHVSLENRLRSGQIDAGAERSTRSGENHDLDGLVGVHLLERTREIRHHRFRERIERFRTVDRDDADPA